jgi:hypothetical protein
LGRLVLAMAAMVDMERMLRKRRPHAEKEKGQEGRTPPGRYEWD